MNFDAEVFDDEYLETTVDNNFDMESYDDSIILVIRYGGFNEGIQESLG